MTEQPRMENVGASPIRRRLLLLSLLVVAAFGSQQLVTYLQAREPQRETRSEPGYSHSGNVQFVAPKPMGEELAADAAPAEFTATFSGPESAQASEAVAPMSDFGGAMGDPDPSSFRPRMDASTRNMQQARAEFDQEQRRFQLQINLLKNRLAQLEARLQRRAQQRDQLIRRRLDQPRPPAARPPRPGVPDARLPADRPPGLGDPAVPLPPNHGATDEASPYFFDSARPAAPRTRRPKGSGMDTGAFAPQSRPRPNRTALPQPDEARDMPGDRPADYPGEALDPAVVKPRPVPANAVSSPGRPPGASNTWPSDGDGTDLKMENPRVSVTRILVERFQQTRHQLEVLDSADALNPETSATLQRLHKVHEILTEQIRSQIRLQELEHQSLQARAKKLLQAHRNLTEAGFSDPGSSQAIERAMASVRLQLRNCETTLESLHKLVGSDRHFGDENELLDEPDRGNEQFEEGESGEERDADESSPETEERPDVPDEAELEDESLPIPDEERHFGGEDESESTDRHRGGSEDEESER